MKKFFLLLAVFSLLFAFLDQISKYFIEANLDRTLNIFGTFFRFLYSENTGIAFSIPFHRGILIAATALLILIVVYMGIKELRHDKILPPFLLALVIGGGLGNLVDRIFRGYVVDFVSIWKYPLFNLADAFIVIGILLLVIFYGKIKGNKK